MPLACAETSNSQPRTYKSRYTISMVQKPRALQSGFSMLEVAIALSVFAVLFAIGQPLYSKNRARSMQADARIELTDIFTFMSTFKEQFGTYHMNFPEAGYPVRFASQTDLSSTSNPFPQRLYAISAGGPLDVNLDEARPVTFESLLDPGGDVAAPAVTRPDPRNYTGWIAPNSTSCNISAASAYGAAGGVTPNSTQATLTITAKGCPTRNLSSNYDIIRITETGVITQVFDVTN